MRGRRLAGWVRDAALSLRWRHLAYAALISFLFAVLNPGGGTLRFFVPPGAPIIPELHIDVIFFGLLGLPLVFAANVADRAVDDGIRPLAAYSAATVFAAVVWPLVGLWTAELAGWWTSEPGLYLFWIFTVLVQCGAGMGIYGYMRQTQRALKRLQASEAERARNAQRVSESRLLALQSRVDPELLFDTLALVLRKHEADPDNAERLLEELISMLHLLLPAAGRASSSVERELELAASHVRVIGTSAAMLGKTSPELHAEASSEATHARLAPLIVLPLVRRTISASNGDVFLHATVNAERLRVVFTLTVAPDDRESLVDSDLSNLRKELQRVYGERGTLTMAWSGDGEVTARVVLEVPYEHDDRTDS